MIPILNKCDIIKVGDEIMVKREKKVEKNEIDIKELNETIFLSKKVLKVLYLMLVALAIFVIIKINF